MPHCLSHLLMLCPFIQKVETIGDAYMVRLLCLPLRRAWNFPNFLPCCLKVAANLVGLDNHHAATMVRFAIRARQEAAKVRRPDVDDGSTLKLRIGGDRNARGLHVIGVDHDL